MTYPVPYHHPVPPSDPWDKDVSHLNTLAICHYVWGAITIVFSSIFIIHLVMGIVFLQNPGVLAPPRSTTAPAATPPPPPEFIGWMLVGLGGCAVTLGWTTGILTIISGRRLARRRSRVFSLVMAGVNCLSVPVGTTLGVFTLIVLLRPSVLALYDQNRPARG